MRPADREDQRYSSGATNPIALEEEVMQSFLDKKGSRVLDVGCGDGTIGILLEKDQHKVIGVDFSAVAVEKAKQNGLTAQVLDVDESGLPFDSESFDVVWAGDIVEHVFDPIGLLKEARRVVRKDGQILFTVPNDITIKRRIKICMSGISPQTEVYRNYGQCKHHTVMSFELLQYFLSAAGLRAEEVLGVFQLPRSGRSFVIRSRRLIRWIGQTIVIRARPVHER